MVPHLQWRPQAPTSARLPHCLLLERWSQVASLQFLAGPVRKSLGRGLGAHGLSLASSITAG